METSGQTKKFPFKTVQIETRLSEYGGNKKAIQTDGLSAEHQNWENAPTIFFHHHNMTATAFVILPHRRRCHH
jgi:hypothetical protein